MIFKHWSFSVASMTVLPILALGIGVENYTAKAILYSFSSTGFWLLFHIFMTYNASLDNKGNDVSIALNGIAIGGLIGTAVATIMATLAIPVLVAAIIGSVLCFASVFLLSSCILKSTFLSPETGSDQSDRIMIVILQKPKRTINTLVSGFLEVPYCTLFPLWLLKKRI
jgi:NAD/NADP transhydrogenase beta subunit